MRHLIISFALLTSFAAAQASFQPFGTGCSINGQALAIGNTGLPQLGQTLTVNYSGPNTMPGSLAGGQAAWPNLALGFGQLSTPIPQTLLPLQPAGCQGYITPDSLIPTAPVIGRGHYQNSIDLPVPNDPTLIGVQFYAQWVTLFQDQCNPNGCSLAAVLTSDAAAIVVGP